VIKRRMRDRESTDQLETRRQGAMRKRGMGDRGKSTHFLETRRQGDVGEKKGMYG
jgi:hypothetical protein